MPALYNVGGHIQSSEDYNRTETDLLFKEGILPAGCLWTCTAQWIFPGSSVSLTAL